MKTLYTLLAVALLAVATAPALAQNEVIVGDGAPVVGNYGYAPSWAHGCCEHVPSHADHLWDGYCHQRHHGGWLRRGHCCGKSFCGHGPFRKGCCTTKCCRSFHLPKFHIPKLRCCKPSCCKAKCCAPKCGRTWHLPKPRLFHGCCKPKCCGKSSCCGKGYGSGAVIEGPIEYNAVPTPVIGEDAPLPPPPAGPAA